MLYNSQPWSLSAHEDPDVRKRAPTGRVAMLGEGQKLSEAPGSPSCLLRISHTHSTLTCSKLAVGANEQMLGVREGQAQRAPRSRPLQRPTGSSQPLSLPHGPA